jgi:hypothetical protein
VPWTTTVSDCEAFAGADVAAADAATAPIKTNLPHHMICPALFCVDPQKPLAGAGKRLLPA